MHIFCSNASIFVELGYDLCFILSLLKFLLTKKKHIFKDRNVFRSLNIRNFFSKLALKKFFLIHFFWSVD